MTVDGSKKNETGSSWWHGIGKYCFAAAIMALLIFLTVFFLAGRNLERATLVTYFSLFGAVLFSLMFFNRNFVYAGLLAMFSILAFGAAVGGYLITIIFSILISLFIIREAAKRAGPAREIVWSTCIAEIALVFFTLFAFYV